MTYNFNIGFFFNNLIFILIKLIFFILKNHNF